MEEIWVEKYRPQKLGDVIGQEDITKRLQAYVGAKNLPHLLFAGPPGTGKTYLLAYCKCKHTTPLAICK